MTFYRMPEYHPPIAAPQVHSRFVLLQWIREHHRTLGGPEHGCTQTKDSTCKTLSCAEQNLTSFALTCSRNEARILRVIVAQEGGNVQTVSTRSQKQSQPRAEFVVDCSCKERDASKNTILRRDYQ